MILAAPFVIPFAEIIGVSIAALGMAKATDKVQEFIEENPEDAIKIFAMIMPEQGLANILKNKSDDGEEISEEELGEVETPKLTGKEKGMRIKEAIRKARAGKGNYSSEDAEGPAVDIRGSVIREVEDMGIADKNLKDNYKKSNFDYKKYFRKADGGMMEYANGGGVGSMMEPKSKTGKAVNELQAKAPEGEFLAYINPDEASMLKRAGGSGKPVNGIPSFEPRSSREADQKSSNTSGGVNNNDYNQGRNMANIAGPTRGPTFSSDGSGDRFAPDDPTLAEKINYTGDTIFGPQQKYSGDGIFSGYRNLDDKGQPLMGMDFVKDKFKGFNPLGIMLGLINPALGLAYRGFNFMKDKVPETVDTFKESDTLVDFYNNMKKVNKPESIINTGPKARDAFKPNTIQPETFDITKIQAMINNAKENPNEFANGGLVGLGSIFTRKR